MAGPCKQGNDLLAPQTAGNILTSRVTTSSTLTTLLCGVT